MKRNKMIPIIIEPSGKTGRDTQVYKKAAELAAAGLEERLFKGDDCGCKEKNIIRLLESFEHIKNETKKGR